MSDGVYEEVPAHDLPKHHTNTVAVEEEVPASDLPGTGMTQEELNTQYNPLGGAVLGGAAGAFGSGAHKILDWKTGAKKGVESIGQLTQELARQRMAPPPVTGAPVVSEHGFHPGATSNAQFNVQQRQANALMAEPPPPGFEVEGNRRILTPTGPASERVAQEKALAAMLEDERIKKDAQERARKYIAEKEAEKSAAGPKKSMAQAASEKLKPVTESKIGKGVLAGANAVEVAKRMQEEGLRNKTAAGLNALATGAALMPHQLEKIPKIGKYLGPVSSFVSPALSGLANLVADEPQQKAMGGAIRHYASGGKASALTELLQLIKNQGGSNAAKRLERSADLVPNLEQQFKPEALKSAFTGDNATALMVMNPKDFKKYATPLPEIHTDFGNFNIADKNAKGNYQDYLDYLGRITKKDGLEDVPYLQLNLEQNRTFPNVAGHEGRNRSEALAKLGDQTSLVRMLPRANLREALPRRSQEEYLEALINKIGNKPMVTPQPNFDPVKGVDIPRGLIQLPEMFKKGGKVKK
jgi:hypothetical protein